ncbi:NEDD4-binding protein 1 isoform X2 [Triplophysa dalaica]|uniref:NEDD4-binding protein 1 isoform X2 n=1 Tax=Triplophysa dalaica TaxID=1582913 RepID=UPI0024DF5C91|nr:NEDD4-binding protein 1 isoform X2 [Triplophysa dalaica]
MALSALTAEGLRSQRMDGETEEQLLEDEFACPGVLRGALGSLRPTVQQVFGVTLSIEGEDAFLQDGQMWLRLRGAGRDVQAAKVFVKGVVNQEVQKEFPFPEALYCVFCGAEGLFMDCLIKNTSAHLVVGSQSCLLITGLEEPVVKAYSFMTDLIEKYESSQGRCSDHGSVNTEEAMDSLQRFKSLVEGREDRHTVSLLVLPVTVKKVLLDLVKQSGRDEKPGQEDPSRVAQRTETEVMSHKRPVDPNRTIVTPGITHHGANGTVWTSDVSNGFIPVSLRTTGSESLEETKRDDESGHRDEFQHLLRFFTVMGFTEEVVKRVLAWTGLKEASQLLDLIQQEQDKSGLRRGNTKTLRKDTDKSASEEQNAKPDDFVMFFTEDVDQRVVARTGPNEDSQLLDLIQQEQDQSGQRKGNTEAQNEENDLLIFFTHMGFTEEVVQRVLARTGFKDPSQLLDLVQQEQDKSGLRRGNTKTQRKDTDKSASEEQNAKPDDFVMGVLKKAAANCGYTEEEVEQVYSSMTGPNPHQLLMELQKPDKRPGCDTTADPRTGVEENAMTRRDYMLQPLVSVRGPPQTTYTSRPGLENLNVRDVSPYQQPMNSPLRPVGSHTNHSFPKVQKISGVQRHDMQSKPRASQAPASTGVTGRQRFIEGLKTPFRLQLSDNPGDDKLRQIIVDGSNVAMSHGLGVFFSCRGIALAAQHFWGRGHRKITVFVPQWRQKKDPKIKEQHYLTDLQDLGLLSFTPSREVEGKRINSYDDRFMLNLAQQTNGVIVTNDNMRDLVDESPAWKDIIKRSLLQYVFAGDLFMLPDDPMGRGGPHLNDFLHTHNSLPPPGSHSFAGVSSSQSSPAPRAHTEVLRYRDYTPGVHGRVQGTVAGEQRGQSEHVRADEDTLKIRQSLMQIFPEQKSVVNMTLQRHPSIKDINRLTNFILEQLQ